MRILSRVRVFLGLVYSRTIAQRLHGDKYSRCFLALFIKLHVNLHNMRRNEINSGRPYYTYSLDRSIILISIVKKKKKNTRAFLAKNASLVGEIGWNSTLYFIIHVDPKLTLPSSPEINRFYGWNSTCLILSFLI